MKLENESFLEVLVAPSGKAQIQNPVRSPILTSKRIAISLVVLAAAIVLSIIASRWSDQREKAAAAALALKHHQMELKVHCEVLSWQHNAAMHQLELDLHAFKNNVTDAGMASLQKRVEEMKREDREVQRAYDEAIKAGVVFEKK